MCVFLISNIYNKKTHFNWDFKNIFFLVYSSHCILKCLNTLVDLDQNNGPFGYHIDCRLCLVIVTLKAMSAFCVLLVHWSWDGVNASPTTGTDHMIESSGKQTAREITPNSDCLSFYSASLHFRRHRMRWSSVLSSGVCSTSKSTAKEKENRITLQLKTV